MKCKGSLAVGLERLVAGMIRVDVACACAKPDNRAQNQIAFECPPAIAVYKQTESPHRKRCSISSDQLCYDQTRVLPQQRT